MGTESVTSKCSKLWLIYMSACMQATQEVVSRLPETTSGEFNAAVQAAKEAFPKWRNTPLPTRSRVMFKLQELIRRNMVSCTTAELPFLLAKMHETSVLSSLLTFVSGACRMNSLQTSPSNKERHSLTPKGMFSEA